MQPAAADACEGQAAAAPPASLATPNMLYDTLQSRTNAQLLAVRFLRKPMAQACPWIYEVRVLTASGSVVELDFDAERLDLVGARGPQDDRDAAALVAAFGGDNAARGNGSGARASGTASNGGRGSGGSGGGSGGSGGGEGGESGSSGGEGGEGGSGGGEGGEGGDSDGGGEGGGEGGDD